MKQHIFPIIIVIVMAISYVACWQSGYRQGVETEKRKAFNAGAAYYLCEGDKTTFVYGRAK